MPFLAGFITFCLGLMFAAKKKRPEAQENTDHIKQTDELITVILPTTNSDK